MNKVIMILILFTLSACGQDRSNLDFKGETQLIEFAYQFVHEAESRGRDFSYPPIDFVFAVTKTVDAPNRIGYCKSGARRTIAVDKAFFDTAFDYQLEALMFHEMGHCVLNRPHNEDCTIAVNNDCVEPESLMYPILKSEAYKDNKDYYLQELFSVTY